jgi:hypothetical protein
MHAYKISRRKGKLLALSSFNPPFNPPRAAKISLIESTDTKNSSRVDKDPEFLEIY